MTEPHAIASPCTRTAPPSTSARGAICAPICPGLSRNALTLIPPGTFAELWQLEELYLEDNFLTQFGAAAFATGALELQQPMQMRARESAGEIIN